MATKLKRKSADDGGKSRAQLVAELLGKKKTSYSADVMFDPEAPVKKATKWIKMPHPWHDLAGVSGVPFGHITTIQGPPDGGKTTIAMHAMVEGQTQGFNVVLIDTEHKFNSKRFRDMGGSLKDLLWLECDTIEDGFQAIEDTIEHYQKVDRGNPILFVWDSLGQTPTNAELRGKATDVHVGTASRVIKLNLRRTVAKLKRREVALVFVNQTYEKVGVMFGEKRAGYGGNGPKFASVLCIDVQSIGKVRKKRSDGSKKVIAIKSILKVTKNHLSEVQGEQIELQIGSLGIVAGSAIVKGKSEDGDDDVDDIDESTLKAKPKKRDLPEGDEEGMNL